MVRIIIYALIALMALIFVLYLIFNKRQKPWAEMSESEKKKKRILLLGGITVFLAGLAAAIFQGRKNSIQK
jgi:uncharacterized membrane protein YfcA